MTFTSQSMQEILPMIQEGLQEHTSISFHTLNPDLVDDGYAGKIVTIDEMEYVYRGYKAWVDLAELCMCKMMTPKEGSYPFITITFKKLDRDNSFHLHKGDSNKEKYGLESSFSQINKMEEPSFLYYYTQALHNAKIELKNDILNLGINTGDEFQVIKHLFDSDVYDEKKFVGIDHSQSAIAYAKDRFSESNVTFYAHDINDLESLELGRFDLIISIGTLQSPGINFKPFFMSLVQNHLNANAAIILGFPNSRWVGGEMIYGAKAPNYAMSEQSLLYNDVMFCKKYLQQKKYRVTITGKQYVFLTATKIGNK